MTTPKQSKRRRGRYNIPRENGAIRTVRVQVYGEELFHFIHYQDWVDHAQLRYRNHGHTAASTIAVDCDGIICTRGKYFHEASYPIRVFAIDEAPFEPCGSTRAQRTKTDTYEEGVSNL